MPLNPKMQRVTKSRKLYRRVGRGRFPRFAGVGARDALWREVGNAKFTLPFVLALAAPAQDFWNDTLVAARQKAAVDGAPILLWIPSGREVDRFPSLQDSSTLRRLRNEFHLARAHSHDVKELLRTFQVKRLPALFLLDQKGGLVGRWDGEFPGDLWVQVDRTTRRLQKSEKELERALAQCRTSLDQEDFAEALKSIQQVRSLARAGYPQLGIAEKLEIVILTRASQELRKILAREGIAEDEVLRKDLIQLKERFPHPEIANVLDRELYRIRSRSIGGSIKKAQQ